jgi:hypothetical protein
LTVDETRTPAAGCAAAPPPTATVEASSEGGAIRRVPDWVGGYEFLLLLGSGDPRLSKRHRSSYFDLKKSVRGGA